MIVLGIESTCDETACAVVRDGSEILSNVVSSQAKLHEVYGGVVPELACRRHVEMMIPVVDQALKESGCKLSDIDLIGVAHAPGLIGALLIGLNTAKALSLALEIPFIGVNHIEAHLYAAIMSKTKEAEFPCLGVVLSGGHTALLKIEELGQYSLIGETIDDAVGEAFDKVAKMMGLPYPGGPIIEKFALKGNPHAFSLKAGSVKGRPFDFSFSGLKTAVLYSLKGDSNGAELNRALNEAEIADMAASFQLAAFSDIVGKVKKAAKSIDCSTVVLGGGVTNNQFLKKLFDVSVPELQLIWPADELTLDNAAMIAGLAYHVYRARGSCGDPLDLEVFPRISF